MSIKYQSKSFSLASPAPASRFRLPIFALLSIIAAGLAGVLLALSAGLLSPLRNAYLMPWILLVFVVVLIPSVYLIFRRRFDLFHPLVYAAWSYLFPAFVLGSLVLASGAYEWWFMALIPDHRYYFSLTLLYIAVGFAGLSLGFALPVARRIGASLSRRFPAWEWEPANLLWPGGFLLVVGESFRIAAFSAGATGYQYTAGAEVLGTTFVTVASLSSMGSFLLWFMIFRAKRRTLRHYVVACVLVVLVLYLTMIAGYRGALLHSMVSLAMAYWLSGRRLELRQGVVFGVLLSIALVVGMVYGTTFRQIKGSEAQVSLSEYLEIVAATLAAVSNRSLGENLAFGVESLLQRLETVSSVAVIVANYEYLRPLEAGYGLANTIWTYTWTAFIPRFIWPDKPLISDARAIGALYFNYGDNSPPITPMADLLRNFGPIGVPLGMALLGFALRILYSALIEDQQVSAWRSVAYYMLLSSVSYEGFYGTILPGWIRTGFALLLGGILVNMWGSANRRG